MRIILRQRVCHLPCAGTALQKHLQFLGVLRREPPFQKEGFSSLPRASFCLSPFHFNAGSIRKLPQLRFLPGALDNCFFQQCSLFRQCRLFLPQSRQVGSSSSSPFTQCHTTPAQCLQRGYVVFRLGNVHCKHHVAVLPVSTYLPQLIQISGRIQCLMYLLRQHCGGQCAHLNQHFFSGSAFQRHGEALPRKKLSLLCRQLFAA